MLFVVASNLFSAFPAKMVGKAVDMVVENLGSYASLTLRAEKQEALAAIGRQVLLFSGLVVAFAVVRGVFMYLMRQNIIVVSRLIEYDLKNELFAHYQRLPLSFYRKNNTGDMMARISEDVSRVRMYIGPALMYFTNLIATFLVVIPIMFGVHARLALFVLLPLPLLSYAIFYVNNIINRKSDEIQSQLSQLTGFAQETFAGMRVIKAFGAERFFRQGFREEAERYKARSLELARVDSLFFPLMVFLTGMSTLITVFLGGLFVLKGEITIGNITEFVIYVNLLTWPVTALGWTSSLVQRAAASQQRINEFLLTGPDIENRSDMPVKFMHDIEFRNVSFRYPGKEEYAIRNMSFRLRKGQSLAVLGGTGSGKSTLVQLLLRMIEPQEGQILVDGTDLREINLRAFREMIGYVPQDVFLFSDTITENIALAVHPGEPRRQELVEEAAAMAGVADNIREFARGYETVTGERGITLSGGQKQRVSIARALVKKPEILVLDDSLSAVDTKTEALILSNLRQAQSGKTSLVVSHRVSTVKDTDYIIVLEKGSVVEEGTHASLLKQEGHYWRLYQRQLMEEVT